jgi:Universal stress protein family
VHTLVLYGHSARADAALRELAERARAHGDHLTVLSLAHEEPARRFCCGMASPLWNQVCRDLARQDLTRARMAVEDEGAELDTLVWTGLHPADRVAAEALAREADEIVLADPAHSGLSRLERRRLRRRSPLPVLTP